MQADRPECVVQAHSRGRGPAALAAVLVLLATLAVRLVGADQPIVENYVGRQVPTAMVARNLERGSGFLWPQLDTGPFPNYFVVEPPVYEAGVVGLRRLSGWPLERCGRVLSAAAMVLGGWALFGLVRRRAGAFGAIASLTAFSILPITLRYGRSFQPDAFMLGAVLAGLECWERAEQGTGRGWLFPAWVFLAAGLAAKITSAFVLVPLVLGIITRPKAGKALLAASAVLPALLWYLWANHLVQSGSGSRASAENWAIWMTVPGLWSTGISETGTNLWRFLVVRAFTPLGLILAVWGLCLKQKDGDAAAIWRWWALVALGTMALLAAKLHHEYYWLCLAPAVAAGIGRAWIRLADGHGVLAWTLALVFVGLSLILTRSTWQTPREWRDLETAARTVEDAVSPDDWVVAPEPLLFQADRRGCRLEFTPAGAGRAAAEWPGAEKFVVSSSIELIDFYRSRGARFAADLAPAPDDARRIALHQEIRRRYKVLVDDPSVIIAELNPSESARHGR